MRKSHRITIRSTPSWRGYPDGVLRITPAADAPWDDVRAVFGERGDPSGCFCRWFIESAADWRRGDVAAREAALRREVDGGRPGPGLIAYSDDEPVGWVAVEPRPAYPRLLRGRLAAASPEPADDGSVWAVTCFVVRVGHRRHGVATALLDAAVSHARGHGARVIEGYPVDPHARKVSSAELYHGSSGLFAGAGFHTVHETGARSIVALEV